MSSCDWSAFVHRSAGYTIPTRNRLSASSASRRGKLSALMAALLFVGLIGTLPANMAEAQVVRLGDDAVSTEVIAQGTSALPPENVAWRVTQPDAAPIDDAELEDQALGFVVADNDSLLVSDLTTGQQALLGPGEATFIPGDTQQQHASLDRRTIGFFQIGLVSTQAASNTSDGELSYAGDPFDSPSGSRDLNLYAATLNPNQSMQQEVSAGTGLVLVTSGLVDIASGGNLGPGDAREFDDEIELINDGSEPARVVIAVIGDEVPPLPTFTGAVTLSVRACPEGATRISFDPASCRDVGAGEGFDVGLLDANSQLIPADDDLGGGSVTWSGLSFGSYVYAQPTLPSPYGSTLWTDANAVPLQLAQATVDATNSQVNHILFVFEISTGAIVLEVRQCPEGLTPATLMGDACEIADPATGFAAQVTEPDGTTLTLADAFVDGGQYVFSGLRLRPDGLPDSDPDGIYTVRLVSLPSDATSSVIVARGSAAGPGEAAGIALTATNPNELVTIYAFSAEVPATAEPEDDEGSVTLRVLACPEGVTRSDSEAFGTCSAVQVGFGAVLGTPDGQDLALSDALTSGDGFAWTDLPAGTYSLGLAGLPAGFADALAPGYGSSADSPSRIDVTISDDNPNPSVTVYIFRSS